MSAAMAPQPQDRPAIALTGVSRRFGAVTALDDVTLDVAAGDITCLVGHSGCGKSTLLRAIAGVERIDAGTIRIDGELVAGPGVFVEPEARGVGLMFQDYALFPHLSVRHNIGFGLKRMGRRASAARVEDVIARVGIGALADRYPHMLSGGEQQRVALARALAPQPRVLLMDEPFSNLDLRLRHTVRRETVDLLRTLGTTVIVVTHDPEEALMLGDRVVLMQAGRVIEHGRGETLYVAPRTTCAGEFFSRFNRVPARRVGDRLQTALGSFPLPAELGSAHDVLLLVRPQAISLRTDGGTAATITARLPLGEIEELRLSVAGLDDQLVMRTLGPSGLEAGDTVAIEVDPRRIFASAPGQGSLSSLPAEPPRQLLASLAE